MASAYSSTFRKWKYDVFLSFRGKDTRDGFLSHLYADLRRNDIETFMDDQLGGGDEISPALLKTIKESNISVVIFSKNYAESAWCLEELEKILECKEKLEQKVMPVFYQVDPSDVQELRGSFGDGLIQLRQQQFGSKKMESWCRALKKISNLKGWDSNKIKPETKLIREIVNGILRKLEYRSLRNFDDLHNFHSLVGIDSRLKEVESLLCIGYPGVWIVGIWGMGGIGKTTIAKTLFSRISCQFERKCFHPNVREAIHEHGLDYVKSEILSNICSTWTLMQKKNVLVVLDDVDKPEQLKDLVGNCAFYGSGSRIIVTSRDRQVLENVCDEIYEVQKLNHEEALELFRLHAFKQNYYEETYLELSERVVNCVDGVPLALEVLGCDLYKKGIKEWKSKLAKLENIPDMKITNVLKISYDGLDRDEKRIFLDIACFFKGCVKGYIERILDSCGFFGADGLSHLTDKALITIANGNVEMHNLIQQMGQEIVSQESNEPGERSRLWSPEDICDVLEGEMGTRSVETISLIMDMIEEIHIPHTTFKGLCNLRLLKFCSCFSSGKIKVHLPNGLEYLPNKLVVLRWHQYPLKSLPSNFSPKNLVELDLSWSCVEQLWDGNQIHLKNLKALNLRNSIYLTTLPDFSKIHNLESIDLQGCRSLAELPSSIDHLFQIDSLDLSDCSMLASVPDSIGKLQCLTLLSFERCSTLSSLPNSIGRLKRLERLILNGCSMLASLPGSICDLQSLCYLGLWECANLNELPENVGNLQSLGCLRISSNMTKLPSSVTQLSGLRILILRDSGISEIPNNLGSLVCLTNLCLGGNNFESIPTSIRQLCNLYYLELSDCRRLKFLPELPSSLRWLEALNCTSLISVPNLFTKENLELRFANFGGCYNLDCRKIMDDDALRLVHFPHRFLEVLVPGSEVPRWFKHKGNVSECVVESLGQDGCDEFLKCAVVAFHEIPEIVMLDLTTTEPECIMKSKHLFLWCGNDNPGDWLSDVDVIEVGKHPRSGSRREEEEENEAKRKRRKTDGDQETEVDVEPHPKLSKKETNRNRPS